VSEVLAERAITEALNEELATAQNLEQGLVLVVEEVEAAVAMVALFYGVGDFRERFDAWGGIVDGGEELDVAVVGCSGDGSGILVVVRRNGEVYGASIPSRRRCALR
jgi:hypothetical protein